MSASFASKPGRPTRVRASAISQAVLEAATEIFLAEGFDGASMDAIAIRAHVPRSTLYKRYPDKLQLLRAVIKTRVAAWSSMASLSDAPLPVDLRDRLKLRAGRMLVAGIRPEISAFIKLAVSAWRHEADIRERLEVVGYMTMVDLVAQDIGDLGPAQGFHTNNPRWVAETLMALLWGWLETKPPAGAAEARAYADASVDLLIAGKDAW